MKTKYFTPNDINEIIPELTVILNKMKHAAKEVYGAVSTVNRYKVLEININDSLKTHAENTFDTQVHFLQQMMNEIRTLGGELKDPEIGLVDFPALKKGQEVCLCWKMGEDKVKYWHKIQDGYNGRKTIDGIPESDWIWYF